MTITQNITEVNNEPEDIRTVERNNIVKSLVYFLENQTAYDALPASGKVSVFNSNMPICLAFDCLRNQGRCVILI